MTPRQLLTLLAREGVLTLVPARGRTSLIELVTGGPIKGSWWGHPQGKEIFALATALEESPKVLTGKLVGGKVAFLHEAHWPAFLRVVTDEGWRKATARGVDAASKKLLAQVDKAGEVNLAREDRAARAELEKRLLVHSHSEHTEGGHHAATLTSWRKWATPALAAAAAKLDLDESKGRLAALGIDIG